MFFIEHNMTADERNRMTNRTHAKYHTFER
jgi:hypothetical protein